MAKSGLTKRDTFHVDELKVYLEFLNGNNLAKRENEARQEDLKYIDFRKLSGDSDPEKFREWVLDDPVGALQRQLDELEKSAGSVQKANGKQGAKQ